MELILTIVVVIFVVIPALTVLIGAGYEALRGTGWPKQPDPSWRRGAPKSSGFRAERVRRGLRGSSAASGAGGLGLSGEGGNGGGWFFGGDGGGHSCGGGSSCGGGGGCGGGGCGGG